MLFIVLVIKEKMVLTDLEKDIYHRIKDSVDLISAVKCGRPRKDIIEDIVLEELTYENYLDTYTFNGKEYYIDNNNILYDKINGEYVCKINE